MTIPELLLAHRKTMLAFARKLTKGHESADDVMQEACLSALTAKTRPGDIQNPKAWLNGHVMNAFRNAGRADGQRNSRFPPASEELCAVRGANPAQEYAVGLSEARSVLDQLPERRRRSFELVVIDGYQIKEAAKILGVYPRSVEMHIERARAGIIAGRPVPDGRSLRYAA